MANSNGDYYNADFDVWYSKVILYGSQGYGDILIPSRIVVYPTLMLHKIQRVYDSENITREDKFYNKKMVVWDQNYTALNVPLACLAALIFGEWNMGWRLKAN